MASGDIAGIVIGWLLAVPIVFFTVINLNNVIKGLYFANKADD